MTKILLRNPNFEEEIKVKEDYGHILKQGGVVHGFRDKNKIKRKDNMSEIKKKTKKKEIMEEVTIIDLDKVYSLLLDPEVPAYFIEHKAGISRSVISKLRQGNRKVENLRLDSVIKVQKWLNDSNFYKDKQKRKVIEDGKKQGDCFSY